MARFEFVDNLLHCDDGALGAKHGLLLHADDAFEQHVAFRGLPSAHE